jgi:hypothetical protein
MFFFADTVIKPYIVASGYRRICEVGASFGKNTDKLLELDAVTIDVVDPCLDTDLAEKYRGNERVRVHRGISLDVLPTLSGQYDCILIDGDHNWYTVYHELKAIKTRDLIKPGGTIFFHDVGWPYGRRDMYFQPELIPQEYIQPYRKEGIVYGESALSSASALNASFCNAIHEGGQKNGVLTAVEDFLKESGGSKYRFFHFEEEHGLGVLLRTDGAAVTATFNKYLVKARVPALLRRFKGAAKSSLPGVPTARQGRK